MKEQVSLAMAALLIFIAAVWYGLRGVDTHAQDRPYSIYRIEHSGQHRCVYVFGNQFGITSVTDYAAGEGRNQWCPALKQE